MAFEAASITVTPSADSANLAEGLLRSLTRRIARQAPSLTTTALLAFVTAGAGAILLLYQRLRRVTMFEDQQLEVLAKYVSDRDPSADGLVAAASQVGPSVILSFLIGALSSASLVAAFFVAGEGLSQLFTPMLPLPMLQWIDPAPRSSAAILFHLVTSLGFVLIGVHAWMARDAMRQFAVEFDRFAESKQLPRIAIPNMSVIEVAPWFALAAVLATVGPVWGAAMALAGSVLVGYITGGSDVIRTQIAESLRAMIERMHPNVVLPARPAGVWRCERERCATMLPVGARFCPRCGRSASPAT